MGTGAWQPIQSPSIATTGDGPKSRCVGGHQPHGHLPGVWSPPIPPSLWDQDFGTSSPSSPSPSPAYPAPRGARRGGGGCCCPQHPVTWWLPVTGWLRAAWRASSARGPVACRRVPAGRGPRFKSKQRRMMPAAPRPRANGRQAAGAVGARGCWVPGAERGHLVWQWVRRGKHAAGGGAEHTAPFVQPHSRPQRRRLSRNVAGAGGHQRMAAVPG